MDDELPPEPLDDPRRLLVWPAPDVATQQALSDRGYRPVIVNSREEVDAQVAAYPAALFVDPLTGPITRTALQSLRQAAGAAEVPVLVTAGLGQATREAAYGADPAVLLQGAGTRDSEEHPPQGAADREHQDIAAALTASLERRGMQVAARRRTTTRSRAAQMRPNLVVMDLMQVRRRRAGIVDWLRANGLLNRTPLVVYTSADIDRGGTAPAGRGRDGALPRGTRPRAPRCRPGSSTCWPRSARTDGTAACAAGAPRSDRRPSQQVTSSSPSAYCRRSTFLSNFPTLVLGTAGIAQRSGSCQRATRRRGTRSPRSRRWAPCLSTTVASGRSPHFSSGTATTAASATCGWAIRWFSSSTEEIHSPPDLMTSLARSVSVR